MTQATVTPATALQALDGFMCASQISAIRCGMRGEEKQFFFDKVAALGQLISTMPKTYEQEGKGDEAIVSLHYFRGSADWYILERDSDPDGEGQIQAFGLADLFRDGGELGYISIPELLSVGAELDMYFTPTTIGKLREIRKARQS